MIFVLASGPCGLHPPGHSNTIATDVPNDEKTKGNLNDMELSNFDTSSEFASSPESLLKLVQRLCNFQDAPILQPPL